MPKQQPYKDKKIVGDCTLYLGDCLDVMPQLDKVDMVLTDLPYGTTACKWDSIIPLEKMWSALGTVQSDQTVFAFTSSQPFTAVLVSSNLDMFKHEWVWIKNRGSNFANTVREPMKEHETVQIFSRGKWTYNKQMQPRTGGGLARTDYICDFKTSSDNYRAFEDKTGNKLPKLRVPSSWQKFNTASGKEKTSHPTQKPVSLMEYLIRTYTNEGDTVLDFTMGSGTTGAACVNTGRKFIGVEMDEGYFNIACDRIKEAYKNA